MISPSIHNQYPTFIIISQNRHLTEVTGEWLFVWVYIPSIQHPLAKVLVGGDCYITKVFVRIKWLDEPRETYPTSMG